MKRMLLALVLTSLATAALPAGAGAVDGGGSLYRIPFASGPIDPAADLEPLDPVGRDLVLVQFDAFGARGLVQAVAATGAALVQPLAPVSYLVWADAEQTRSIRAIRGVRWAGVLPPAARISPSVTAATTSLRVTVIGTGGLEGLDPAIVDPRGFTSLAGAVVKVAGGVGAARRLAANPRVYSVAADDDRPETRDEQSAQIVAAGTKVFLAPGYKDFLTRIGADGSGVVVSHIDTGADLLHPDLSGRPHVCDGYGTYGSNQCAATGTNDLDGHGTHTLGIILGSGTTPFRDSQQFLQGQGMAPGATAVVANAIGLGSNAFSGGYRGPYQVASRRGATVSGNSWGPSATPRGYDANTRTFDSIVRDADTGTPGDQPMTLVFSIMNGSGGTSTQGSPDEGKNILGVGASGSRGGRTPDDLCTCTAHGPALDGRLLPDLVAPGQSVLSTAAAVGASCRTPFVGVMPSPIHGTCTGTSMASPHVTGGTAVFTEWYRKRHDGQTPSPALVKAAFVNGADDLAGNRNANGAVMGPIPNNQQGWGRFNLGNVMDAWIAGTVHIDQTVVFDAAGAAHTLKVEPRDPTKPLKVTLAWTDALGHGLGGSIPAWVNDLDLSVRSPDDTVWRGNVFAQGFSAPGGSHDRRNNVENIFLAQPGGGTFEVRVSAVNLLGDGIPSRDGLTDQDFALVITNARLAG
ncbi:MAG TPA: S8 family serine peptidase [Actinomycetota bacterium]|nr:S8 family serine peptidase [Actinomycetota bacterium]